MPFPFVPVGIGAAAAVGGWVARMLADKHKRSKQEQEERERTEHEQAEHEEQVERLQADIEKLAKQVVRLERALEDARQEGSRAKNQLEHVEDEYRTLIDRVSEAVAGDPLAAREMLLELSAIAAASLEVTGVRDALIRFQAQRDESGSTPLVVVPPDLRDSEPVAKLDKGSAAVVNGQKTFKALMALAAYADAVERGTNQGRASFQEWCQANPDYWAHHLVALSESESVERDPKLRDQRIFPIDPSVNLSSHSAVGHDGKAYMGAHIKLKQGEHAPRLYFYDDTGVNSRGNSKSGKVHVGHIGPHRPTKRFKS